jgi:molecular chaperone DnaJ
MDSTAKPDYYELLGLDASASEAEVKRAYRQMARQHHPDVNRDDPEAEERFKQISEAYAVLSDPERRERYDRFGHNGPGDFGSGGPVDIFDVFSQAFGGDPFGFGRGFGARTVPVGQSLRYDLEITLEDVLNGAEKEIRYGRLAACEDCDGSGAAAGTQPRRCGTCGGAGQVRSSRNTFLGTISTVHDCPECKGSGEVIEHPCETCRGAAVRRRDETVTVQVPAGVEAGDELVMRGFGSAPIGGGRTGDLHVRIHVARHDWLNRSGEELHTELALSFSQAALGYMATVAGLDGEVEVRVPAGTQTGEEFVLAGRGLPRMRSVRRGDLHVHARVVTPTHLTERQRELLMTYAAEGGEDVHPEDRTLFERIKQALTGR